MVLVRTGTEESKVAKELRENGAHVIEFPKWEKTIVHMKQAVIPMISECEKILFTSSETVTEFFDLLAKNHIKTTAHFFGLSVKTLRVLQEYGLTGRLAEHMPTDGKLLIVGDQHIEIEKQDNILKYGEHEQLITSTKYVNHPISEQIAREIIEMIPDILFFPSKKSVHVFVEQAGKYGVEQIIEASKIVCMGSSSYEMTKRLGLNPDLMPNVPTIEALLDCLVHHVG